MAKKRLGKESSGEEEQREGAKQTPARTPVIRNCPSQIFSFKNWISLRL